MNSSIGKWIKSIIIIYQCFTHLKLLVQIQAGLGDWLDGISRNPRYLNEDNFKVKIFQDFLILNFKSDDQKNKKKISTKANGAPYPIHNSAKKNIYAYT